MTKEEMELRKRKRRLTRLKSNARNKYIDERIRHDKDYDSGEE